jgi:hypothetical protein
MKRSALILLTAVYLLSLVGIGINRFYCCGKLASVTLTIASRDYTDNGNCCKHESKSFKLKDSHVNADFLSLAKLPPALLPAPAQWVTSGIATESVNPVTYLANAPPDHPAVPIYTINCAYRI